MSRNDILLAANAKYRMIWTGFRRGSYGKKDREEMLQQLWTWLRGELVRFN